MQGESTLAYTVEMQEASRLIRIVHTGSASIEEFIEARQYAADLMKSLRYLLLLVDVQYVNYSTTMVEQYEFALENIEVFPPDSRIAVVLALEALTDGRFVEDVALEHGVEIRMFTDPLSAEQWLKAGLSV